MEISGASVTGGITGSAEYSYPKSALSTSFAINGSHSFTNGVLAEQAEKYCSFTGTITGAGYIDLDLGEVLDAWRVVAPLDSVRALMVKNTSDVLGTPTTSSLKVGAAASNPWFALFGAATHYMVVRAGGFLIISADDATGYVVTEDSADILRLTNGSASDNCGYEVLILGTSGEIPSSSSSSSSSSST